MKRLTIRLRQAFALRRKHRRILNRSEVREDELLDAIHDAEKEQRRKRKRRRKLRDEERRSEKQDSLADEIEDLEAVIDRLTDRLDRRKKKSQRARTRLHQDRRRVERLQRRRKRIRESRGDISANFSAAEFDCREGGPVPTYMYDDLEDLCDRVLERMRQRFGSCHVNSGHRWEAYNRKIGGASQSYHVYEYRKSQPAADVTFARGTPSEWGAYARSLGVGGVGTYSTFCHVDLGPRRTWYG